MSELIKSYLEAEDTPATVLGVICMDLMTNEFLTYEVETLVDTLQSSYGAVLPQGNIEKLSALQLVYTTNAFYMSIPAFVSVVDAFNSNGVDFEYIDMPHPADMAWAIVEVLMNVPEPESSDIFSPDVLAFIAAVMVQEGFTRMPKSMGFLGELPMPEIRDTLMDDPDIYAAYAQIQGEKTKEVEDYVSSRVMAVMQACTNLPLKHRDTESWNKLVNG